MSLDGVALVPTCAECGAPWLPADEERWRAYHGGGDLDEPASSSSTVRNVQSASSASGSADDLFDSAWLKWAQDVANAHTLLDNMLTLAEQPNLQMESWFGQYYDSMRHCIHVIAEVTERSRAFGARCSET